MYQSGWGQSNGTHFNLFVRRNLIWEKSFACLRRAEEAIIECYSQILWWGDKGRRWYYQNPIARLPEKSWDPMVGALLSRCSNHGGKSPLNEMEQCWEGPMDELEPQRAIVNARDSSKCRAIRKILWLLPSSAPCNPLPEPLIAQI